MKYFENKAEDRHRKKAEWEHFYALTKHWLSDLKFHRDELKFFNHLVGKYVLWLTSYEEVEIGRTIQTKLAAMRRKCLNLLGQVETHLDHLSDLIENPSTYDAQTLRKEHADLEDEIAAFIKTFEIVKKETFDITEHLLDSEEVAKHL